MATGATRQFRVPGNSVTEQDIRAEFFRTRDAAAMLAARTSLVDRVVRERWAWMPGGVALVAVGGYGRA